jgi:hypothetical protein
MANASIKSNSYKHGHYTAQINKAEMSLKVYFKRLKTPKYQCNFNNLKALEHWNTGLVLL